MAESDVEKIKSRVSIQDVVGQYVQLRRAGRTFTARCPFHKERTPSFHVSPERGTYKCFGCGEGGDIFTFLEKIEGIDFPTALKQLAEKAGIELSRIGPRGATPEEKQYDERLREVCEAATQYFEAELDKRADVQKYLADRAVKDETKKLWRLGYAPPVWRGLSEHLVQSGFSKQEIVDAGLAIKSEKQPGEVYDRFRGRVMFPLCDAGGKVIAFSGRFFERTEGERSDSEPAKYVNSPETALFHKSKVLFGFDKAKNAIRKADCILLVEGQFDVVLSHQSGLPFTVAISGTALTPEHLSLLGRLSKRLVLALDGDAAGLRAGLKSAAMALAVGFDVKVPTFPDGKDPADLAKEDPELLRAAIRGSKTTIEFFLDVLRRSARDERMFKKLAEAQVLPLVALLPSKIEQAHFIRLLAERLRVPESAVAAEVAKRPATPEMAEAPSPELHKKAGELPITPLEKKAAMLLFYFGEDSPRGYSAKLGELLGAEKLKELIAITSPQAEDYRFMFEQELGEHTSEQTIAQDMLADIERAVQKERLRMKFL